MMVRLLVRPDGISTLSSEGSGETAPVPVMIRQGQGERSMRLSGGAGGSPRGGSAYLNGSYDSHGVREELQHCSSSSSSKDSGLEPKDGSAPTGALSRKSPEPPAGNGTESLDSDSQLCNGSPAEADEHSADSEQAASDAGQDLGTGQDRSAPELQHEVTLGNTSVTSSVTNTDMALYEDLETLQDESSALGDLSSESEEDAAVAAERLKLGHFPVEVGPPYSALSSMQGQFCGVRLTCMFDLRCENILRKAHAEQNADKASNRAVKFHMRPSLHSRHPLRALPSKRRHSLWRMAIRRKHRKAGKDHSLQRMEDRLLIWRRLTRRSPLR